MSPIAWFVVLFFGLCVLVIVVYVAVVLAFYRGGKKD